MTGTDDPYALVTHIARLQHRAQRRWLYTVTLSTAVAAAVFAVLYSLGDDIDEGTFVATLIILGLVVAGAAFRDRHSTTSRVGPVGGLPLAQRRRVMRGIRRGEWDRDPVLHEVQVIEVGLLRDQRKNLWTYAVLTAAWWGLAAIGDQPITMRAVSVGLAALYSFITARALAKLRGVNRILASG